jgi:DNA repair protein RadA/Sms
VALAFQPNLIIVDSIQTLSVPYLDAMPGSISQIRECAGEFQRFAKSTQIPVFLIGHITKDGTLAGPKLLEHIVDTVLQFEGEQQYTYRILRTLKNRFGSTDELGIYEMHAGGLRQVSNPSELLLSQHEETLSGSAVAATQEGMRPMLIETQALVSKAIYGNPQRSATGFEIRRLSMLLAVLEKRGGLPFGQRDVFLNIAGGIRVDDPGIDLAIVAALISSLEDVPLPPKSCFVGEVGLSGEIRAVHRIEQRIQEAARLGFETIYLSKYNLKGLATERFGITIHSFGRLEELYTVLFT